MKVGSLEVVFHRTVRVADGRITSNLPPSLGTMKAYKVSDYKDRCPADWDVAAVFVALHDTEALWMSFRHNGHPVAVLVGAGGINALTGEKLGTKLVEGNYLTAPPQPWLDGWKNEDGSVCQFVATPYKAGKGITVAEQLIGAESKTGAIGLAVFEPKDPGSLKLVSKPYEGFTPSSVDNDFTWAAQSLSKCADTPEQIHGAVNSSPLPSMSMTSSKSRVSGQSATQDFGEMGIGKGGKIHQKIYPDPYGIEVWKDAPAAAVAVYVVNAEAFQEITGEVIPAPTGHESYGGVWFGLKDEAEKDVPGTAKFTGLKSAFVGDTSNVEAEKPVETAKPKKKAAVKAKGK